MRQLMNACLLIFLMLIPVVFYAQDGIVDIRITKHYMSCDSLYMLADLEIKANSPASHFSVADLNIRFSFNRAAFYEGTPTNPAVIIVQELTLSGVASGPGHTTIYDPHTLTGSHDTVVSYNVLYGLGDGYPVTDTAWVAVSRIQMQVRDLNTCQDIWFHTNDPGHVPPTFVSEKHGPAISSVDHGVFTPTTSCFSSFCNVPPIAIDDYITTPEGIPVVYNVLNNDNDPNNNLDPTTLTLISTPPPNEITVTTGPGTGELTITPTGLWSGNATPFSYEICDDQGLCHSADVYVTVVDDPQTSVNSLLKDKQLKIYPTITSDQVTIEFEEGWHNTDDINLKVYVLSGHLIIEERIGLSGNGHTCHISLESWPIGTYFIQLSSGNRTSTTKIVKQ